MAVLVLIHNRTKTTNIAFAAMCGNLMLWSLGVAAIVNSGTEDSARMWLQATFVSSCFLPATFYNFLAYYPLGRFGGYRSILAFFYVIGALLGAAAYLPDPWYIEDLRFTSEKGANPLYGPVFNYGFSVLCILSFSSIVMILFSKLRGASGIQLRQLQYIILGFCATVFSGLLTNVFAPLMGIQSTQQYGPVFVSVMMLFFAYAIIRYHLMDISVIISRTTTYAIAIAFVTLVFFGTIQIVFSLFHTAGEEASILATLLAAVVIVVVLEPLKEYITLGLNRIILQRRYDVHALLARTSSTASRTVKLDSLLWNVCEDIKNTVGVTSIRVYLIDEKDLGALSTEYSSAEEEMGSMKLGYGDLLAYFQVNQEPIVLEQLIHSRMTLARSRIAEQLSELDAYMCIPLRRTTGLIGLMVLGQKASRDIFTSEEVVAFTALSTPLTTAIENARLYRKLEEANLHRERILSNMRGGVVAVDSAGRVTTVNRGATEILGPIESGQSLDQIDLTVARSSQASTQCSPLRT